MFRTSLSKLIYIAAVFYLASGCGGGPKQTKNDTLEVAGFKPMLKHEMLDPQSDWVMHIYTEALNKSPYKDHLMRMVPLIADSPQATEVVAMWLERTDQLFISGYERTSEAGAVVTAVIEGSATLSDIERLAPSALDVSPEPLKADPKIPSGLRGVWHINQGTVIKMSENEGKNVWFLFKGRTLDEMLSTWRVPQRQTLMVQPFYQASASRCGFVEGNGSSSLSLLAQGGAWQNRRLAGAVREAAGDMDEARFGCMRLSVTDHLNAELVSWYRDPQKARNASEKMASRIHAIKHSWPIALTGLANLVGRVTTRMEENQRVVVGIRLNPKETHELMNKATAVASLIKRPQ